LIFTKVAKVPLLFFILFSFLTLSADVTNEPLTWNPRISREKEGVTPPYCVPFNECCIPYVEPPTSYLSIGGSYSYAYIKPTDKGSTAGSLGGMQALYEYKPYNRFYGAAAGFWKQGNTERSGDRFLVQFDIEERLGYTWGSCRKERLLTLFSGFGYRRNADRVTRFGHTVRFYYNEFYIPVGFLFKGRINSVVSLGLNFHWMPQVFSTVLIRPLKGARWCLNNKIDNFRAELPLTLLVSQRPNIFIVLEPYFEYWRDGHTSARTKLGTSLHVPGNTYLFTGIQLDFGYSF
jgi:hypothetical protein